MQKSYQNDATNTAHEYPIPMEIPAGQAKVIKDADKLLLGPCDGCVG